MSNPENPLESLRRNMMALVDALMREQARAASLEAEVATLKIQLSLATGAKLGSAPKGAKALS